MKLIVLIMTFLAMVITVVATSRKSIPPQNQSTFTNSSKALNSLRLDGEYPNQNATLVKRDQGYRIPLRKHSEQDIYYGYFNIGFPRQKFRLVINTTVRRFWVLGGSRFYRPIWEGKNYYDPDKSEPPKYRPYDYYGIDRPRCRVDEYEDYVYGGAAQKYLGETRIFVCHFGNLEYVPILDGEVGLAYNYPIGPVGDDFPRHDWKLFPTFFQLMVETGQIETPVFGLYISREIEGSELILGDYDKTKALKPLYVPVMSSEEWRIRLTWVRVGGREVVELVGAVLDTSSPTIRLPASQYDMLYESFPEYRVLVDDGGGYEVPCDSIHVSFAFGKVAFNVHGKAVFKRVEYRMHMTDLIMSKTTDGYCRLAIDRHDFDHDLWILGIPFFKNVYTIFDWGNARVGFQSLPYEE